MNRRWIKLLACLFSVSFSPALVHADNLVQVYHQAYVSDPIFKTAQATWLVAEEDFPVALTGTGVAGSGLFPYVDIVGDYNYTDVHYRYASTSLPNFELEYDGYDLGLTVTQPIFNYQTWKLISKASADVKAAAATYAEAAQSLISRTAIAYFEVLRANDILAFTKAETKQYLEQLRTAQQKFKVGVIPITGVYDAQASYDQALADQITYKNQIQINLETLRAITSRYYNTLTGLRHKIPLVVPKPGNISVWVQVAERQNNSIKAANYQQASALQAMKAASAGRYPAFTASGALTRSRMDIPMPFSSSTDVLTQDSFIGSLNMSAPVIQGGHVFTTTKQARYAYLEAADNLQSVHANVVMNTRQSFLNVRNTISKIKADQQAIVSTENQLQATQAGYEVGTRTMVDLLDAVTALYSARQQWANDRYDYIDYIIALKADAGTLSVNDVKALNNWLRGVKRFPSAEGIGVKRYSPNLPTPSQAIPVRQTLQSGASQTVASQSTAKKPHKASVSATKKQAPQLAAAVPSSKASVSHARRAVAAPVHPRLPVPAESTVSRSSMLPVPAMTNKQVLQFERPALHFAVEVFVAQSKAEASAYALKHQPIPLRIEASADHLSYRVLYGHFSTEAQAQKELVSLPPSLTAHHAQVITQSVSGQLPVLTESSS